MQSLLETSFVAETSPASARLESAAQSRLVVAPARSNFLFVDNVRFASLVGITLLHSFDVLAVIPGMPTWAVELADVPVKFGTYGFFLAAGFLMGQRFLSGGGWQYFKDRLAKIGGPAVFWFLLCTLSTAAFRMMSRGGATPDRLVYEVGEAGRHFLTTSSYWFIPNLLISTLVLVCCRRYLFDVRLGALLLTIDLGYVANLYVRWSPIGHGEAIFGFTFELWLGAFAAHHYAAVKSWLGRTPGWVFAAGAILLGSCSFLESRLLALLVGFDSTDTLRLSNQLFSICVVLGIVKLQRPVWPSWFQTRRFVFGMFLVQPLFLLVLAVLVRAVFHRFNPFPAAFSLIAVATAACGATFLGTAGGAFVLVRLLAAGRVTSRLIGA